jgi:Phosphoenolpyruvate phosphomutase
LDNTWGEADIVASARFVSHKGGFEMRTREEKAVAFRALHERPGAFIIPNPWEAGTAKLLAAMGFEALATTSLGLANMLGRADSRVTRDEVIANCRIIAEATDLPVNADLENCFAHEPEAAAEAIRLAAEAGAVGGQSRTTPAIIRIPSTILTSRSREYVQRSRLLIHCRCRSCSPRGQKT